MSEVGHNSEFTEADFAAVNLGKLMRADAAFQEAKNEHQSVTKHVEGKGLDLKAAKQAIKIKKSGKVDEKVSELSSLFMYLKILGCAINEKQIELFSHENSRTPLEDRAYEEGLYAGRMGEGAAVNPYGDDSKAGQKWLEGLHTGTGDRSKILEMEMTAEDELIKGEDEDPIPFDEAAE